MTMIAERILKVGLKATVPVFGELAVAAIEETAGALLEKWEAKRVRDVERRLIKELESQLDQLASSGEFPQERIAYLVPTIEMLLKNYGIRESEWSALGFNTHKAASRVLERGRTALIGLDEGDRTLCHRILLTFYSSLQKDQHTIAELEPQFRATVLERIGNLQNAIEQLSKEDASVAVHVTAAALLYLPARSWMNDRSPPGALLRADFGVVPFHGRAGEIKDLLAWCAAPSTVALRLYTGAGGIGKSRLFIELCTRLRRDGWHAGFLTEGVNDTPLQVWRQIFTHVRPLLIVLDYAETRRDALKGLLRAIDQFNPTQIRIVMLARAADDWWETIKTEGEGVGDLLAGPATSRHFLKPLAPDLNVRKDSFLAAGNAFARVLNTRPPSTIPEDIDADHFGLMLLLHMSALASVEGIEVKGDQGILNWMLARERRFWSRMAEERGLPEMAVAAIEEAMAVLTLGGGATSRDDALVVFDRVELLKGESRLFKSTIANLLHQTYPGDKWIEPIMPDLLAEHFIQCSLEANADKYLDIVFGAPEGREQIRSS